MPVLSQLLAAFFALVLMGGCGWCWWMASHAAVSIGYALGGLICLSIGAAAAEHSVRIGDK